MCWWWLERYCTACDQIRQMIDAHIFETYWLSDFIFTFHFHALEKEMATHSSILAWRISGTGEPGGLPSVGSCKVGHDRSNLAAAAAIVNVCVCVCVCVLVVLWSISNQWILLALNSCAVTFHIEISVHKEKEILFLVSWYLEVSREYIIFFSICWQFSRNKGTVLHLKSPLSDIEVRLLYTGVMNHTTNEHTHGWKKSLLDNILHGDIVIHKHWKYFEVSFWEETIS